MAIGIRIAPDEHEVELREWLAVSWNEPDCRVATDVETEGKSSTAVSEENILGYRCSMTAKGERKGTPGKRTWLKQKQRQETTRSRHSGRWHEWEEGGGPW
jgi:hypothetical protein